MQGIGANRRKRLIIEFAFLGLLVFLIVFDQITKYHFSTTIGIGDRVAVIDGFFYFTYTLNNGAAWSFLSGVSWAQTFFKIITIVALIIFTFVYVYSLKKGYKWLKVSLIFIISGTIGNFIDRLFNNGCVVDFLSFVFDEYSFPVFNLADTFLVVGMIMFVIHLLFIDRNAVFKKKDDSKKVSDK